MVSSILVKVLASLFHARGYPSDRRVVTKSINKDHCGPSSLRAALKGAVEGLEVSPRDVDGVAVLLVVVW